jgi:hypothetical protein
MQLAPSSAPMIHKPRSGNCSMRVDFGIVLHAVAVVDEL